jgi:hypothetical protein
MTRSLRGIDWAALGANVGSAVLFTLLLLGPFLVGAHYSHWLLGLAIGSSWACTSMSGGSATASQAPTQTRPGFHGDQPSSPLAGCAGQRLEEPQAEPVD